MKIIEYTRRSMFQPKVNWIFFNDAQLKTGSFDIRYHINLINCVLIPVPFSIHIFSMWACQRFCCFWKCLHAFWKSRWKHKAIIDWTVGNENETWIKWNFEAGYWKYLLQKRYIQPSRCVVFNAFFSVLLCSDTLSKFKCYSSRFVYGSDLEITWFCIFSS